MCPMTEGKAPLVAIELLLVLTVQTTLVRALTGTPLGDRTVFDIEGGSQARGFPVVSQPLAAIG
jgi:hypothetical protein